MTMTEAPAETAVSEPIAAPVPVKKQVPLFSSPSELPRTTDPEFPCERWISVPWYDCDHPVAWIIYAKGCEIHEGRCTGHFFCDDHFVVTITDRQWRAEVATIQHHAP